MKRKIIMVLLSACIALSAAACGYRDTPSASDITRGRERENMTEGNPGKEAGEEDTDDTDNAEDTVKRTEKEKAVETGKATGKKGVVFGSGEAVGYNDFKYLTEAFVSTSQTESKEEAVFAVYIPDGENLHVFGASARSGMAGVSVKVDLEPNLQYKAETYTVYGNLENYVDGEMDYYYDNYYDMRAGRIEEIDEDSVACEVSYMKYDSVEDTYSPYDTVYALYDLGDQVLALVTVTIDADNMTDETEALLAELSSFYQFDISWDESDARIQRDIFESDGEAIKIDGVYYLEYLSFELPEGWEIDEDMSGYGETVFVPKDALYEDCYISIDVIDDTGLLDMFLEEIEEMEEYFYSEYEDGKMHMEDVGDTFLGHTVMIEATYNDGPDAGTGIMYLAEDDENTYMITGFAAFGDDPEKEEELTMKMRQAIVMFLETGQTRRN